MTAGRKLSQEEFLLPDPADRARFFLGKRLICESSEGRVSGLICETEAYGGAEDKACHAYGNRRTPRTEMLFRAGGVAYVYFCYGMHHLLNFVTGPEGVPQAVLIRGIRIVEGHTLVRARRGGVPEREWANGPAKVCEALGVHLGHNGLSLLGETIWVEDQGIVVSEKAIVRTPRIGVSYAEEWAEKPLRFVWRDAA
ncbi:Putative 3-methyladenine DNA glycosylase [Methylacidimicrobium cyclopophantes]|uniref:Putative 3-methyladenine DNA glycosylase n=1 Tax=Methylacidimicrobium cyclopophantes TaxID=1041766 RepID=A0A5E6M5C3_9BACT|nr:DNA-3-methyladenine glycosylase [Methylacidimicrobium cyclopophantes]VVM04545.1 Putative 3-methyladenine DNA glycosylase [Methylacidimicrobium cyclopophantes]